MKKGCFFKQPFCRGDRIRTCDPLVPNQVRYRPALLPVSDLRSDPDRIRTCDLLLRRQLLYPAELRGPTKTECKSKLFLHDCKNKIDCFCNYCSKFLTLFS